MVASGRAYGCNLFPVLPSNQGLAPQRRPPGQGVHLDVFRRRGDNEMSFLAWIVLGLVAGFIGSKLVNKTGEGFFLDILLGIVGAVVGGWLFGMFGAPGVTGLNLYSLLVA